MGFIMADFPYMSYMCIIHFDHIFPLWSFLIPSTSAFTFFFLKSSPSVCMCPSVCPNDCNLGCLPENKWGVVLKRTYLTLWLHYWRKCLPLSQQGKVFESVICTLASHFRVPVIKLHNILDKTLTWFPPVLLSTPCKAIWCLTINHSDASGALLAMLVKSASPELPNENEWGAVHFPTTLPNLCCSSADSSWNWMERGDWCSE